MAQFLTVKAFKASAGITTLQVVKNPNTGLLFGEGDNGVRIRVQQDLDTAKNMRILVPEIGDVDSRTQEVYDATNLPAACLINAKETTDNVFATL